MLFASLSSVIAIRPVTSGTAARIASAALCAVTGLERAADAAAVTDSVDPATLLWFAPQATAHVTTTAMQIGLIEIIINLSQALCCGRNHGGQFVTGCSANSRFPKTQGFTSESPPSSFSEQLSMSLRWCVGPPAPSLRHCELRGRTYRHLHS